MRRCYAASTPATEVRFGPRASDNYRRFSLPAFGERECRRGSDLDGAKSDGQGMDRGARSAILLPEKCQRHRQAEAARPHGAGVQP